jgi:hypothetical protein
VLQNVGTLVYEPRQAMRNVNEALCPSLQNGTEVTPPFLVCVHLPAPPPPPPSLPPSLTLPAGLPCQLHFDLD